MSFKTPKPSAPPPPPAIPDASSAEVDEKRRNERQRAATQYGRQATILTGPSDNYGQVGKLLKKKLGGDTQGAAY